MSQLRPLSGIFTLWLSLCLCPCPSPVPKVRFREDGWKFLIESWNMVFSHENSSDMVLPYSQNMVFSHDVFNAPMMCSTYSAGSDSLRGHCLCWASAQPWLKLRKTSGRHWFLVGPDHLWQTMGLGYHRCLKNYHHVAVLPHSDKKKISGSKFFHRSVC